MTSTTPMETVTSADGTPIAYERSGSGPPLVLVHGSGSTDHEVWKEIGVHSSFVEHCTLYAIDRRGCGESDDADEYELKREFEDVAVVVDSIDEPVNLFGHSFGAHCALEASLRTDNLRTLMLYEPWFPAGDHWPFRESEAQEMLTEVETLLDDDENEQAFVMLLRLFFGPSSESLEERRSDPDWQDRIDRAHTWFREMKAENDYEFNADRFSDMTTPTLLLSGRESYQYCKDATAAVNEALPNSRIVILEGGHRMSSTLESKEPERFINEVLSFIREPS